MKLTDHFSWDEMTITGHEDLLLQNKMEAKNFACAIYLTAVTSSPTVALLKTHSRRLPPRYARSVSMWDSYS